MTAKTLPERLRHYTGDTQLADNYCEDMHAAADEIERMHTAMRDYFAAADAAWIETCQEAAKHGLTSIPILPGQAKALEQYNKLRRVFGS